MKDKVKAFWLNMKYNKYYIPLVLFVGISVFISVTEDAEFKKGAAYIFVMIFNAVGVIVTLIGTWVSKLPLSEYEQKNDL